MARIITTYINKEQWQQETDVFLLEHHLLFKEIHVIENIKNGVPVDLADSEVILTACAQANLYEKLKGLINGDDNYQAIVINDFNLELKTIYTQYTDLLIDKDVDLYINLCTDKEIDGSLSIELDIDKLGKDFVWEKYEQAILDKLNERIEESKKVKSIKDKVFNTYTDEELDDLNLPSFEELATKISTEINAHNIKEIDFDKQITFKTKEIVLDLLRKDKDFVLDLTVGFDNCILSLSKEEMKALLKLMEVIIND